MRKKNEATVTTIVQRTKPVPVDDPLFDGHVCKMQDRITTCLKDVSSILFTTDASGLWEAYLAAFPATERQHFNCHACKHFIESVGGLVVVGEDGSVQSPFWEIECTGIYADPFWMLRRSVHTARITGVFYSKQLVLGTPESNGWTHWAVRLPAAYSSLHKMTLTPAQAMAEKHEDFKNVMRALDEFSADDLAQAVRVLQSEALYRSEHLLGAAEWLARLQDIRRTTKNRRVKEALLWRAVALAPSGFCHPRSGMLGTLLEDIQARLPFEDIKRRFDAKMHPLQYQRPQAPPAAATIAQAEKLVEQLGIAASLKRRFARLDEIEAIWQPVEPADAPQPGGVFAHLQPKGQEPPHTLTLPPTVLTWEKFRRVVLPTAERIEFLAPHGREHYTFLTTAVDPEAPPILQWDTPEHRNPVAWYGYNNGLPAPSAGLDGGVYHTVRAITMLPCTWSGSPVAHHGESAIFVLAGCRDVTSMGGLALFPECLRSELHGVRAVIEAHSRTGRLEEPEGPLANGIRVTKGATGSWQFRVWSRGQRAVYRIDRWD